MGKYDGVDVFGPADGQGVPCHFDDGDSEMDEDADCQQDLRVRSVPNEVAKGWLKKGRYRLNTMTMPLMKSVMTTGGITRTAR